MGHEKRPTGRVRKFLKSHGPGRIDLGLSQLRLNGSNIPEILTGQEYFEISRVGSGRVGSDRVG